MSWTSVRDFTGQSRSDALWSTREFSARLFSTKEIELPTRSHRAAFLRQLFFSTRWTFSSTSRSYSSTSWVTTRLQFASSSSSRKLESLWANLIKQSSHRRDSHVLESVAEGPKSTFFISGMDLELSRGCDASLRQLSASSPRAKISLAWSRTKEAAREVRGRKPRRKTGRAGPRVVPIPRRPSDSWQQVRVISPLASKAHQSLSDDGRISGSKGSIWSAVHQ